MDPNQDNASGCSSSDVSMLDQVSETTQKSSPEHGGVTEILSASAEAMEDAHKTTYPVGLEHSQDGSVHAVETEVPDMSVKLRSYQKEMLEQSLHRNVIVTMDTGTGKTRIAIMRMQAELETCDERKLVWFLAPKVALCVQQHDAIRALIPAAAITVLTGSEAVDTWKATVWRAVLESTRIVVSTPAVLRDALTHAFISMDDLTLIVIDEAHNAVKNNPARRIMTDFYHPRRQQNLPIPSILGLTASPSMNSTETQLYELEETLDAICIAPTIHRDELIQNANRPQIRSVLYAPDVGPVVFPQAIRKLRDVYRNLDIRRDPYVLKLKANPTERNLRKLRAAVESRGTWSQVQIRGLLARSQVVFSALGSWAANRYIYTSIRHLNDRVKKEDAYFDAEWFDGEEVYLKTALGQDWPQPADAPTDAQISEKCQKLIRTLLAADGKVVGIVFVRHRVIVMMLKEVLMACPNIRAKYRIGTQVGANTWTGKARELFEIKDQNNSLPDFISGKIDLMIATNVLEEGIDIPACNLVVCFDLPHNAKSFIQQKGRARNIKSELVLFFENTEQSHREWEAAEMAMKRLYEDESRERLDLKKIEHSEDLGDDVYIVPETGARLDFENAKSHLQHFCAVLARGDYIDHSPDFITRYDANSSDIRCSVSLPTFVAPGLRRAESRRSWKSEKNATKDAAFQAYKALHQAGWLTDNLLPLRSQGVQGVETREAIVPADQLMWPWSSVARSWQESGMRWAYTLSRLDQCGRIVNSYELVLPVNVPPPTDITVYLDNKRSETLRIGNGKPLTVAQSEELPDHTSTLLGLHFKHRWHLEDRAHIVRIVSSDTIMTMEGIGAKMFVGADDLAKSRNYLVRDREGCPMIYEGIIPSKPEIAQVQAPFYELDQAPDDTPYLHLSKWTRRSDFLHPVNGVSGEVEGSDKPYSRVYPMSWARVDTIPLRHAEFGMLIPSVIHELEVMLLVHSLSTTILGKVQISNMELVREAMSSRSSSERYQYERLEFLGDSILKYCTSVQLSADHTEWPEGYLSFAKDKLVANSRLSRSALETGLAKYILTKPFTGQKWRPLYLIDALKPREANSRRLSTKTLADVVEALIGASFADGGLNKALQCISIFINERSWRDTSESRDMMVKAITKDDRKLGVVGPVQELIGYEFKSGSLLLEALTHASYIANPDVRSLERLEFLGDAVLDYIIVTRLYSALPKLNHGQMHMLKTALVNGDFLAFVALERRHTTVQKMGASDSEIEEEEVEKPLWMYMRHTSPAIFEEQKATVKRHDKMRNEVNEAIAHGSHYPWALLARLQTKKFYSDLIEALLGAVWIDSGSIEQCEAMLITLGILPYLERMLRDKVHVQHPKEELTKAAGSVKVKYEIDVQDGEDGEKEWLCKLWLGERIIADVKDGVNKEEVKTKAAAVALAFLHEERETSS